jgi:DNA-binding phage protein
METRRLEVAAYTDASGSQPALAWLSSLEPIASSGAPMKRNPRLGMTLDEMAAKLVGEDGSFAAELLREAAECLLDGEPAVALMAIRNVIKGSLGYAELSRRTGIPEKSLIRMFGPAGNPTAANLARVIGELQRYAGVRLEVHVEAVKRRRPAKAQRRGTVA